MQTNPEVKAKRELTPTALILGVILAVVFGAANAYLGLRVGLTVSASVPAAVVSMAVLRFVLRRDSILENNMVQTIGSAGESLAAGAIFTLPAIYLWAEERPMDFSAPEMLSVTLIALAGGLLGVLLMVPLRRPLIVEDKALTYPEGVACADVLKAGEAGAKHARNVFVGLGAGAAVKTVTGGLKWMPENFLFPVHGIRGALGFDVSPALLGVGYIVGTKVSTLLFGGTLFGWLVLLPILAVAIPGAGSAWDVQSAQHIWKHYVRYVGVGAIAMGGFISLVRSLPVFLSAFMRGGSSVIGSSVIADNIGDNRTLDLPMKAVVGGVAFLVLFIWLVPAIPVSFLGAVLIALFGFFFATVSARMVGLVGSSNNPISGMTIATLVVATLALRETGTTGAAGMVAAIAVGSVVCIVAAIAGDTAQDLKTGNILGATPWKQQTGEVIGVIASSLAIGGVLILLHRAWGFGSDAISAPQAMMMKSIVEGIMGDGLPWGLIAGGAVFAVVLTIFRVPVMPVAIGMYLPVGLGVTMFVGGLLRWIVDLRRGETASGEDSVTLLSAGLIAGEGLCGILLAIFALF